MIEQEAWTMLMSNLGTMLKADRPAVSDQTLVSLAESLASHHRDDDIRMVLQLATEADRKLPLLVYVRILSKCENVCKIDEPDGNASFGATAFDV
jgi:hypothetical protein